MGKPDRFPTRFKKGHVPWNTGRKGISYPGMKATQFKPGNRPGNKAPIGTEKIRTRKRDGQSRVWMKISDNGNVRDWQPRARFIWELHNGPIPKGQYVIHKIDDDTMNDAIENLQLMTRAEHIKHHLPEFEDKLRKAQSKSATRRWKRYRERMLNVEQYDKYYWEFEAEADQEMMEART